MKPTVLLSKSQISLGLNIEHNCLYSFMHFGIWDNIHLEAARSVSFTPPSSHLELLYTLLFTYIVGQPVTRNIIRLWISKCQYSSGLSYRAAITHNFHSWSWFSLVSLVKLRSQNHKTLELPFSVRKNSKSLHLRCWKRHKIYIFCLKNDWNNFFNGDSCSFNWRSNQSTNCGSSTL